MNVIKEYCNNISFNTRQRHERINRVSKPNELQILQSNNDEQISQYLQNNNPQLLDALQSNLFIPTTTKTTKKKQRKARGKLDMSGEVYTYNDYKNKIDGHTDPENEFWDDDDDYMHMN